MRALVEICKLIGPENNIDQPGGLLPPGYIPPDNSATDQSNRSVTDLLFGPSAKIAVNNVNIHVEGGDTKLPWQDGGRFR